MFVCDPSITWQGSVYQVTNNTAFPTCVYNEFICDYNAITGASLGSGPACPSSVIEYECAATASWAGAIIPLTMGSIYPTCTYEVYICQYDPSTGASLYSGSACPGSAQISTITVPVSSSSSAAHSFTSTVSASQSSASQASPLTPSPLPSTLASSISHLATSTSGLYLSLSLLPSASSSVAASPSLVAAHSGNISRKQFVPVIVVAILVIPGLVLMALAYFYRRRRLRRSEPRSAPLSFIAHDKFVPVTDDPSAEYTPYEPYLSPLKPLSNNEAPPPNSTTAYSPPNSANPIIECTRSYYIDSQRTLSLLSPPPTASEILTERKMARLGAAAPVRRTTIIRELDAGSADVRVLPPLYDELWASATSETGDYSRVPEKI